MMLREIFNLLYGEDNDAVELEGNCEDCSLPVTILISKKKDVIEIEGGAVFKQGKRYLFKCKGCFDKDPRFTGKSEAYSRKISIEDLKEMG